MSLWASSVALFGAGLTSSLSPCVLPLVPGYVGALSDSSGAPKRSRVALFTAGATLSFVVLGSIAGALGWKIGSAGSAIERAAGVLLVVLALGLVAGQLGWVPIEFHPFKRVARPTGWRVLLLGVGCGAAWSPCVGPLLGAALTAAGGSGSPVRGSLLLSAYAVGVLVPFFVVAAVPLHRVNRRLRRLGRMLPWITASVMIVVGVTLATGWYQRLTEVV